MSGYCLVYSIEGNKCPRILDSRSSRRTLEGCLIALLEARAVPYRRPEDSARTRIDHICHAVDIDIGLSNVETTTVIDSLSGFKIRKRKTGRQKMQTLYLTKKKLTSTSMSNKATLYTSANKQTRNRKKKAHAVQMAEINQSHRRHIFLTIFVRPRAVKI